MQRITAHRTDGNEGFSLIELVVVVLIIGVLATIAIPTFLGQRSSAADGAAKSDARNLAKVRAAYDTENNSTPDLADMALEGWTGSILVSHALCSLGTGEFAVGAVHSESATIWVVDDGGRLVESTEATLQDALNAVMAIDCAADAFYDQA